MKKKLSVLLFIILECLLVYVEKMYLHGEYGIERFCLFSFVNLFICCHLFFDIHKMYDFIYRKRYVIATIILFIFSALGYHGSSIAAWDGAMQPEYHIRSGSIMLGKIRAIRGDEYFVSTPTIFSQDFNNFDSKSDLLMARSGYVNLFPTLPCRDISILGNLYFLPYLLLPLENAFSMAWFLKVFLIFFASFELCMLVCEKKRLYALLGAIMITFSGASCWWSNMTILGLGALAVVIMHLFLKSDKVSWRLFYSVIMGLVGANYVMLMYPAWQVPFGYLYLGFFIWLFIENRDKLSFKMLLYVPIVLAIIFGIFLPVFLNSYSIYLQTVSTVYPGARLSVGGTGKDNLFSYYLSVFFSIKEFPNPSEYGNFMSLYPLPILVSICIFCKNIKQKIWDNGIKKKCKLDSLLIILTVIAILLSIWNYVEIPVIVSKITLLSYSTAVRCQLVVGYICIFIILRIMSKYESNTKLSWKKLLLSIFISIIFNGIILSMVNSYFDGYLTKDMILILLVVFIPVVTLFIINHRKSNFILVILLIGVSFFAGVFVNPLAKGIGVMFEKPVAKEIQKIVKEDKDARWLAVTINYSFPNYIVANGGKTINSTNYYPNLKLWNKIDPDKEYEDVYNRYAHIQIKFTDKETKFQLLLHDYFLVYLNVDDLDKLDVQYIFAEYDISEFMDGIADCVYEEGNIYIYKVYE